MSTQNDNVVTINDALASVPTTFRDRLVRYYGELKQAYMKQDYDACGSRSGKFCETLIRFCQQQLTGAYTLFGQNLNLYDESRRLEQLPGTSGPEPLRVFIPRAMCFLYTLRNKRGFAHVGGDVDSDPIDAATCVRVADWCLCELIRVVHDLSLEEAQALVNTIAAREVPFVWSVAGKKRVLKKLDYKSQALLLLYTESDEFVAIDDLFEWTEYSSKYGFQKHVVESLHQERLVEFDAKTKMIYISPTGVEIVETEILTA